MPTLTHEPAAARLFILPMTAERALELYPVIGHLCEACDVFVVVTETGRPVLVTDTHAEAVRQVRGRQHGVLDVRH